ncbi:HlyD family secretion protein [Ktedonosporobacter rubrisoli]|uniref:HlyD family secretion protein n=1 Tax=Ktedonosporobacter rubrisoli TaxID=2509675 RepID=A0A4P6JW29_KTERU|nr:HlyD family efflux transporter periplasmic adaptor subunit [Ktedonosporobacter rubrisoli]QBD79888.1 HlyD family secretion protein [Ktedonosporobacter rubrisoli]
MRRTILVPLLITIALLAIAGGAGYWIYDNHMYYRTDDAQVTGQIVNLSSIGNGQLSHLDVKQGDTVSAGQTIATIAPTAGAPNTNTIAVTSPISGTILQTSAVQGQTVTSGLPIAQVTDLHSVNVTAYIDEGSLDNVKTGQDVDIHIDAYSDTNFTGKVVRIVQAAAGQFSLLPTQDNASGNFTKVGQRIPVIISLDGSSGKDVLPGMSAEVTIHIH